MKLKFFMACMAVLCFIASGARADPAFIESTSSRLTPQILADVAKEVAGQGKIPDVAGQRLRLSCDDAPLPPDWVPGTPPPLFSWSCMAAREQKVPVVTAQLWAPTAAELLRGTTGGDAAALREDLKQQLMRFMGVPGAGKPAPPQPKK